MEIKHLEKLFDKGYISKDVKRIIRFFLLAIWGGFLFFLLWQIYLNKNQILLVLKSADYSNLLLIIVYYFMSWCFAMVGWLSIVRTFYDAPSWWVSVQIYSATFASRRLPGTMWYVGGRMVIYQKLGFPKSAVLISSAIELIIAIVASGCVGIALFQLFGEQYSRIILIILISLVGFGLVISNPKFLDKAFNRGRRIFENRARQRDWLIWIAAFVLMWISGGMMLVQIVRIFYPVISMQESWFIIGSWALSGMIGLFTLFLPSSFGVSELSIIALLSTIMPLPLAGIISIFTRFFTIFMEVLLSILFYPAVVRLLKEPLISNVKNEKD